MHLRPIVPSDYEPLFQVELSNHLAPRWRSGGTTPSFETYVSTLFDGVLAQYVVVDATSKAPIGHVAAYGANLAGGWAYFAAAKFDPSDHSGRIFHGVALLWESLFANFDLHKLYAEVPEYNMDQFRSVTRSLLSVEARLTQHVFWNARRWDQYTLALSRQRWDEWRPVILDVVHGTPFRQTSNHIRPTRTWPNPADPNTGHRAVKVLDADEFLDALRSEFEGELDPDRIDLRARLIDDLELDSLQVLRLVVFVESLGDIELPDDLDLGDASLGDLHYYYDILVRRASSS